MVLAVIAVGAVAVLLAGDAGPDADQQEKSVTKCLRAAGLKVKSDIPSYGRITRTPEYELDVDDEGGNQLAYVFLFDHPEEAETWVDEVKLDAETEDEEAAIEQRGPAAVSVVSGAPNAGEIRGCVDKAAKEPVA